MSKNQAAIIAVLHQALKDINQLACCWPAPRTREMNDLIVAVNKKCLDMLGNPFVPISAATILHHLESENERLNQRVAELEYKERMNLQMWQGEISKLAAACEDAEERAAEYHANWFAAERYLNFIITGEEEDCPAESED